MKFRVVDEIDLKQKEILRRIGFINSTGKTWYKFYGESFDLILNPCNTKEHYVVINYLNEYDEKPYLIDESYPVAEMFKDIETLITYEVIERENYYPVMG